MKFKHLNVPNYWKDYWTRYPEGYTILEALLSWVKQVDDMVDGYNQLTDSFDSHKKEVEALTDLLRQELDTFVGQFDKNLQETVNSTIEDWQQSGFLEVIISNALQSEVSTKQTDQMNFISYIERNKIDYDQIIFKKHNSVNYIHIVFRKDNRHITYVLRPNTVDDYIVLAEVFAGAYSERKVAMTTPNVPMGTNTGTWVTGGAYYTTEVGATFDVGQVTGQFIDFNSRVDTDGGIWEFAITDGDTVHKKRLSTFSSVATPQKIQELISFDEIKTVSVTATFIGADPNNPPASGTARGWVNQTSTLYMKYMYIENSQDIMLSPVSNKEFAFRMRKTGIGNHEFVPTHGEPSAKSITPSKLYVDGTLVDVSSMTNQTSIFNVKEVRLLQSIHGMNTAYGSPLVRIDTTTTITESGVVSIAGKMVTLEDIEISTGYPIMIPVGSFASRLVTGIMNEYQTDAPMGENAYLVEEYDSVGTGVFLSDTNPDYALAYTIGNPRYTLRQGEEEKGANPQWLERRTPDLQKVYNQVFNNTPLPKGYTYRWNGELVYAEVPNINQVF